MCPDDDETQEDGEDDCATAYGSCYLPRVKPDHKIQDKTRFKSFISRVGKGKKGVPRPVWKKCGGKREWLGCVYF